MGRIRTIKPEFFTSEDIVALTPLARLLYVALWCEADREGRLEWKPKTFKMRYMPADKCDAESLCREIVDRGLVVLYGSGYAFIPSFSDHQRVNPREAKSTIPPPDLTRANLDGDASILDLHAQVGKEGEGREGEGRSNCTESGKPTAVPEVPVMEFPVEGVKPGEPRVWHLLPSKLLEYQETYPMLDVPGEFKVALQWLRDNPPKRKTPTGMPKYLNSWLTRAQEKGHGSRGHPSKAAGDDEVNAALSAMAKGGSP